MESERERERESRERKGGEVGGHTHNFEHVPPDPKWLFPDTHTHTHRQTDRQYRYIMVVVDFFFTVIGET